MPPPDDALRYPIGRFTAPAEVTPALLAEWIAELDRLPGALAAAVHGLTPAQLDALYRPGGWTVRQVVHHVADSHTHALVRTKQALAEDAPLVLPYDERAWATLPDVEAVPVGDALAFLDALHRRWTGLLRALDEDALRRPYVHAEDGPVTVAEAAGRYAWHGHHHLAHVTRLAAREGWHRPSA
jgi:hypothetical protein